MMDTRRRGQAKPSLSEESMVQLIGNVFKFQRTDYGGKKPGLVICKALLQASPACRNGGLENDIRRIVALMHEREKSQVSGCRKRSESRIREILNRCVNARNLGNRIVDRLLQIDPDAKCESSGISHYIREWKKASR